MIRRRLASPPTWTSSCSPPARSALIVLRLDQIRQLASTLRLAGATSPSLSDTKGDQIMATGRQADRQVWLSVCVCVRMGAAGVGKMLG